jgi:hypothetical protein
MAYEVNRDGDVKVFTFTVHFLDTYPSTDERISEKFVDYTEGWNWARQIGEYWASLDSANYYEVLWDYTWESRGSASFAKDFSNTTALEV